MFSMQNIDKNYFNPILNFQQNVQQSSAFLSLIVPDLFSVDSQGQKDRQVQKDRYKDKDVLYHRMAEIVNLKIQIILYPFSNFLLVFNTQIDIMLSWKEKI